MEDVYDIASALLDKFLEQGMDLDPAIDRAVSEVMRTFPMSDGVGQEIALRLSDKVGIGDDVRNRLIGQMLAAVMILSDSTFDIDIDDTEFKKIMEQKGKSLQSNTGGFVHKAIDSAKSQLGDFKLAGTALQQLANHNELSAEQQKALKKVALQLAVNLALAVFHGSGATIPAYTLYYTAQDVALKSVSKTLHRFNAVFNGLMAVGDDLALEVEKAKTVNQMASVLGNELAKDMIAVLRSGNVHLPQ